MFAIKNQHVFIISGEKNNHLPKAAAWVGRPTHQDFHVLTFGFAAAAVAIRDLVFVKWSFQTFPMTDPWDLYIYLHLDDIYGKFKCR